MNRQPNTNFPYYCDECGFLRSPAECSKAVDCKLYRLVQVESASLRAREEG